MPTSSAVSGKGLIKVSQAPARRYKYYLTPHGFAEKSRLTAQFFSDSFTAFRRWRQSYDRLFAELEARGVKTAGLCGRGELVEIAVLCSLNSSVEIVGIWNPSSRQSSVRGIPVIELDGADDPDCWILAENDSPRGGPQAAARRGPGKARRGAFLAPSPNRCRSGGGRDVSAEPVIPLSVPGSSG